MALKKMDWWIFGIALIILAISFLPRPIAMAIFLRDTPDQISFIQSSRAYFISQLTKYLPGGIWVFPSRVVLLAESGVSTSLASLGLAFESLTMVISSGLVGLLALETFLATEIGQFQTGLVFGIVSVLGLTTILFAPEIILTFVPRLYGRLKILSDLRGVTIKQRVLNLTISTGSYLTMWVLTGIGFYGIVWAIAGDLPDIPVLSAVGIFSLSWLIGFLSVFNPGGIGLREAAIVLLLRGFAPEPIPILVAVLLRVAWSIIEVGFFGLATYFMKPKPKVASLR